MSGSEQQGLAFNLRGIPEAFRSQPTEPTGQAGLAEGEIRALDAIRESLKGCDAFERETTRRGLADGATPELRRVIGYEAALQRRLRWCLDQRRIESPPVPATSPVSPPSRTPEARPAPGRPGVPLDLDPFDDLDVEPAGLFPASFAPKPGHALPIATIPAGPRQRVG